MNIFSILQPMQKVLSLHRNFNCWTAAITKKHRKLYLNSFPVYLVLPDGSSINIDYEEPRKIVILPLDLNTISEEERQIRLEKRKPIVKAKLIEEYEDDFDETQFYK